MEVAGLMRGEFYLANQHHAHVVTQELYPRLITLVRDLAGGSLHAAVVIPRTGPIPSSHPFCTEHNDRRSSMPSTKSNC